MQTHEACQGGFADCHTRGDAGMMSGCPVSTHKEFLRIFWGRWVAMPGLESRELIYRPSHYHHAPRVGEVRVLDKEKLQAIPSGTP